jgi:hypothetical protein
LTLQIKTLGLPHLTPKTPDIIPSITPLHPMMSLQIKTLGIILVFFFFKKPFTLSDNEDKKNHLLSVIMRIFCQLFLESKFTCITNFLT